MNKNFKPNERELVKVAGFFKRHSEKLITAGKLGEEHRKVGETVDRFIEQMEQHADSRALLLEHREGLRKLVKDNAMCPECKSNDKLKLVGTETNEKGWKSNRYKCRKCNILFTWNMPNNPWDMIQYVEEVLTLLHAKYNAGSYEAAEKEYLETTMASMQANLDKLKPVIEAHAKEYDEFLNRESEMEKLIHEFKNTLLIEKIKLDTWENRSGN